MRIGVIGPKWPDAFAANIMDGLAAMGLDVISLGSSYALGGPYLSAVTGAARQAFPALDERAQRGLADRALHHECDVVINVEQCLMPDVVRRLRSNGVKVAFWFPDAVVNMGRQLMLLAGYDALFFKEPHLVERLRVLLDLPVFYLPQACNPNLHQPLVAPATERYLVIAGNMYPSRIRLLERLMAEGVPLRLYGAGFPRWTGQTPLRDAHTGRSVYGTAKAAVFRSAVAVLNNLHPAEISGINLRVFEAAGCGAAVLTEFRPTLPELFATGDEVLAFRDFDELISQAKRLLEEDGLSAKLGDAAALRAHRDHTYPRRLAVLLEKLG
jgi:spore maturation protein CgeB